MNLYVWETKLGRKIYPFHIPESNEAVFLKECQSYKCPHMENEYIISVYIGLETDTVFRNIFRRCEICKNCDFKKYDEKK